MTIEGAIAELQNLIKADDVPFYYDGVIRKVIETIIDERPIRCEECRWYELHKNGTNGECLLNVDAFKIFYPNDFCSYGEMKE